MSLLSHGCCLTLTQMFHWLILSSWECNTLLFRESSKEAVNDPVSLGATRLWIEGCFWLVIYKSNCEHPHINDEISVSSFPQSDGSAQYWGCGRDWEGEKTPSPGGSQKGTQYYWISRISSGQLWTHWRVSVSLVVKGVLLSPFPNFFKPLHYCKQWRMYSMAKFDSGLHSCLTFCTAFSFLSEQNNYSLSAA